MTTSGGEPEQLYIYEPSGTPSYTVEFLQQVVVVGGVKDKCDSDTLASTARGHARWLACYWCPAPSTQHPPPLIYHYHQPPHLLDSTIIYTIKYSMPTTAGWPATGAHHHCWLPSCCHWCPPSPSTVACIDPNTSMGTAWPTLLLGFHHFGTPTYYLASDLQNCSPIQAILLVSTQPR